MIIMKCGKCGFENLESAHVCRKCSATLVNQKNLLFDESSNKSNLTLVLGLVIVILLVIIGLFAYGTFNQPTETQTPVVTNHTDIKPVNNTEVVYVANETGSGSNVFSLDAGSYIINISVTPLKNNSYFK